MSKSIASICIVLCTVVLLTSCEIDRTNQEVKKLEVDFSSIEEKSASDFFGKAAYIPISTQLNEFIGQISKIITTKDRFYLLDKDYSSSVFVLNHEGELISAIYPEGDGPSEFDQVDDISFDFEKNQLLIYAGDNAKILTFSANGEFVSEQKKYIFSEDFVSLSNHGQLAFYTANQIYENRPFKILYFDSTLQITDEFLLINEPLSGIFHGLLSHFSNYNNEHFLFVDSFNDTVYAVNSRGTYPLIVIDFMNHKLTQSDIASKQSSMDLLTFIGQQDKAFIYGNILHNENWLFFLVNKGRNVYQLIYDRKNESTYVVKQLIDDLSNLMIFPFIDLYDGNLYSFVDKEYLSMQEQLYNENGKSIPANLDSMLSSDHQFYLAKYTLKQ